jgi:F-box/leucine-rich repeat protein 10/11
MVMRPVQAAPIHRSNDSHEQPYVYNKTAVLSVFKYLSPKELATCACVCRIWARYSLDPSLWRTIDLSHSILSAGHLSGIIQRQPETLVLDWTNIVKRQLAWLLSRLPQLRNLSLKGCNWTGVCALNTYSCPALVTLDLSFVSGNYSQHCYLDYFAFLRISLSEEAKRFPSRAKRNPYL